MEAISCEIPWSAALFWFGMGASATFAVSLAVVVVLALAAGGPVGPWFCEDCGRPIQIEAPGEITYLNDRPHWCQNCTYARRDIGMIP